MRVKVSDYIIERLATKYGVKHIFLVTGGGAMHLNDSIGKVEGVEYICNHHEQASAIAAEGYYRASGRLCATCVTTGPGGTNAITGVLGQWTDSIPAIYLSGQVKYTTTIASTPELDLRQLGDQEINIIDIVRPITKYAQMITDASQVKAMVDKAVHIATSGRPGPVWLDVPLNIQGAYIEEEELVDYVADEELESRWSEGMQSQLEQVEALLREAQRPVLYVGNGLRLAGVERELIAYAETNSIPVVTAISGHDLIDHRSPVFFGKPGICGDRLGNIMVQNSDLLIVLGTRLSIRQVGYAYDLIAPGATVVMVDIDGAELKKPTLNVDIAIETDLRNFVPRFAAIEKLTPFSTWCEWGRMVESRIPTLIDDNPLNDNYASSFLFAEKLFDKLEAHDVVVTGNGTAYTSTFQALRIKDGVRVFANQGCAAMGYDLPAAIGAAVANNKGKSILVTGDGSIQMNIQELQTVMTYNLPLKIFVLNNDGYLAIKTTQKSFFEGRLVGSTPQSGVVCPDLSKIASAYGVDYVSVSSNDKLDEVLTTTLDHSGAIICEVFMDPFQTLFPKASSYMDDKGQMQSHPLEKMAPFMDDDLQAICSQFARKRI